jgi:hypothetical protein
MGTGSPFPGNKAVGVQQTLQTFVRTNFKESLPQEQKNCFRNINAMNFEIRTLGYLMVIAGNSGGTLH